MVKSLGFVPIMRLDDGLREKDMVAKNLVELKQRMHHLLKDAQI